MLDDEGRLTSLKISVHFLYTWTMLLRNIRLFQQ